MPVKTPEGRPSPALFPTQRPLPEGHSTDTGMAATRPEEVTELLRRVKGGDAAAMEELMRVVYGELRRLAAGYLRRERADHTLQATALVNEAYIRLAGQEIDWESGAHFFGIAATTMRRILVEHARGRNAEKRGGGESKVPIDDALCVAVERPAELLALDEALRDLEALDPVKGRVIELHYFAGLTAERAAAVLGVSAVTVNRHLRFARAWLTKRLAGGEGA